MNLSNMKLVEGSNIWESMRDVKVTSVDIINGTLKSNGIHNYTIKPTFEHHEFMNKIGFSHYYYEVRINKVVSNIDGTVTIHTEMNSLTVEMTEEQLNEWKEFAGGFITFINADGTEDTDCIQAKEDDFNDWFATLGN